MYFYYDANGQMLGFRAGMGTYGSDYYYQYNLQGDVVGILTSSGSLYCRYTYDTWGNLKGTYDYYGNPITSPGHVGNINPIRYRGYFYDAETGFYYLQSRYYDPNIGRFISMDDIMGANSGILSYNLFCYCGNSPIIRYDTNGKFWEELKNGWDNFWGSVAGWFEDNFGAQTSTTVLEQEVVCFEESFCGIKVSKTMSVSYELVTGEAKTVTGYADPNNMKVGIKTFLSHMSGNISIGLDGLTSTGSWIDGDTTYSFTSKEMLYKMSFTFSITTGNMTESYEIEINKVDLAIIAVFGTSAVGTLDGVLGQIGKLVGKVGVTA